MNTVLQVDGMSCGGCAASVERALRAVEHVRAVEVDLASGRVSIESDTELAADSLARAVSAIGFDARPA